MSENQHTKARQNMKKPTRIRSHSRAIERDEDDWMTTYADTITLLLAFFVILTSFATFTPEKFSEAKTIIAESMSGPSKKTDPSTASDQLAQSQMATLTQQLEVAGLESDITLDLQAKKIELIIEGSTLFANGQAALNGNGAEVLRAIAPILVGDYVISIEGHTDDQPISNHIFPSNWELSSARSASVARLMVQEGISSSRLQVVGHADTVPIASNATAMGRAKNRRVHIILEFSLI
jgi:chemotaxis protein MotB